MSEPMISVRGTATVEAEPEIARLSVQVQSKDGDRRKARDQLIGRNQQCLELVREYDVEKLETGGLSISPVLRYRRREGDIHYYQGTAWIKITVSDFGTLGELVGRLADLERTSVHGPYWALRHDSPVYRDAARQAVKQALERAGSYAEALGIRLTGLVELADEGLTTDGRKPELYAGRTRSVAMDGGPGGAEPEVTIDLEPETQTVRATVEARFTASAPEL